MIFESDSLNVVNAMTKNIPYMSEVGYIFDDCRSILRRRFDFMVQHVRRQANKVAHSIAHLSSMLGSTTLLNSPPTSVLEAIMVDKS